MVKAAVPDAVITALMLMFRAAVSVSRLAPQETASLTLMSPDPATVEPWLERMVTLLVPSADESVAPEMSPEGMPTVTVPVASAAMVKSCGSISHVPVLPEGAFVVTRNPSFTVTFAADVSIKPPSPPLGAEASSLPPTMVSPYSMSDMSIMRPFLLCNVRASMMPLWLTTALVRLSAAWAVITTRPPSALIKPWFAARASMAPWCTV